MLKKIYLLRSRLVRYKSIEFGERRIEKIFQRNGYRVIYPETMKIWEQIPVYRSCKVFVSSNGTVAHNILWATKDTTQVELNRMPGTNDKQDMIASMMGNPVININVAVKNANRMNTCYIVTEELMHFWNENDFRYNKFEQKVLNLGTIILYQVAPLLRNIYHRIFHIDVV